MKKWVWLLGIILFVSGIIYSSVSFSTSIDSSSKTEGTDDAAPVKILLAHGESITLTGEEAALEATPDQKKVVLTNLGMTCTSCKAAVTAGLKSTEGIKVFYVNLSDDRATIVYDPNQISIDVIIQSIADVGYQVGEIKEVQ